ncbi:unnamed protein product [Ixodes pacificus]
MKLQPSIFLFEGHPVFLLFMMSACISCIGTFDHLTSLVRQRSRGFS